MQEYNVEWSPDAQDDLDNCWSIIYEESCDFDTADNFVNEIIDYTEDRCRNPKGGHKVEIINDELYREVYYRGYTVVYEIIPKEGKVIIHEVYNQKRIFIRSYKRE